VSLSEQGGYPFPGSVPWEGPFCEDKAGKSTCAPGVRIVILVDRCWFMVNGSGMRGKPGWDD
jgi:hypothetical protein